MHRLSFLMKVCPLFISHLTCKKDVWINLRYFFFCVESWKLQKGNYHAFFFNESMPYYLFYLTLNNQKKGVKWMYDVFFWQTFFIHNYCYFKGTDHPLLVTSFAIKKTQKKRMICQLIASYWLLSVCIWVYVCVCVVCVCVFCWEKVSLGCMSLFKWIVFVMFSIVFLFGC